MDNKDTEFTLKHENQFVTVSPFGASLRRYYLKTDRGEWNAIWGYQGGVNKKGGQGDVLIPFPGRIKNAQYKFAGQTYDLPKNDKDGPNAIHGFLRAELFAVKEVSDKRVVFTTEIQPSVGYPFRLKVEVLYALSASGLKTTFEIKNVGEMAAPVGAGFHPYFRGETGLLADWSVTIPARDYIELVNIVPTGRVLSVEGTKLDFRNGRTIGIECYNDCVAHLSRDESGHAICEVRTKGSPSRVVIRMDEILDYVVIYTGDQIPAPDHRQGFAIEPMTCAPDAFNHENWGSRTLKPSEVMTGSYTIFAEV